MQCMSCWKISCVARRVEVALTRCSRLSGQLVNVQRASEAITMFNQRVVLIAVLELWWECLQPLSDDDNSSPSRGRTSGCMGDLIKVLQVASPDPPASPHPLLRRDSDSPSTSWRSLRSPAKFPSLVDAHQEGLKVATMPPSSAQRGHSDSPPRSSRSPRSPATFPRLADVHQHVFDWPKELQH